MRMVHVCTAVALAAGLAAPASGQWLRHPTPGVPRLADGKPNLAAPAPRTADGKPDLSGIWEPEDFRPRMQTPGMVVILYEAFGQWRQIFTDGRPLPKDPNPMWLGYSVGKWEGDTLVVDTIGFNGKAWLDQAHMVGK